MRGFFVRKTVKAHGTQKRIEGCFEADAPTLLLEDVTTTGGSSMKAIEAVRSEGAEVVKVLTMVDRQEGAAEAFAKAGIPFGALLTAAELR